jgi:NADH-quinone oxidoreductase subunit J
MLILIIFFVFSSLAVGASLGMLFSKNVLYIAFLLLLILISISALYVLAGADFLAIAQIVIYVGGVLVLLLFGIMLSNQSLKVGIQENYESFEAPQSENKNLFWGILAGISMLSLLSWAILQADFENQPWLKGAAQRKEIIKESTVSSLGIGFMTDYALVFELVALLLLVALIGSVTLAAYKHKN